jgi:hypothetical protein
MIPTRLGRTHLVFDQKTAIMPCRGYMQKKAILALLQKGVSA